MWLREVANRAEQAQAGFEELTHSERRKAMDYGYAVGLTHSTLWDVVHLLAELSASPGDERRLQESYTRTLALVPFQEYELRSLSGRMRSFETAFPEDSNRWHANATVDDVLALDRWSRWLDRNFDEGGDPENPDNQGHALIAALDEIGNVTVSRLDQIESDSGLEH